MMPPHFAAPRILRLAVRGKDPLPTKFSFLVGIFLFKGKRKIDLTKPALQIAFVLTANTFDLFDQILTTAIRQHRDTSLSPFPDRTTI